MGRTQWAGSELLAQDLDEVGIIGFFCAPKAHPNYGECESHAFFALYIALFGVVFGRKMQNWAILALYIKVLSASRWPRIRKFPKLTSGGFFFAGSLCPPILRQ